MTNDPKKDTTTEDDDDGYAQLIECYEMLTLTPAPPPPPQASHEDGTLEDFFGVMGWIHNGELVLPRSGPPPRRRKRH